MMPQETERAWVELTRDTLRLVSTHADILPEAARFAQGRQLQRLEAIVDADGEPGTFGMRLPGRQAVIFLQGLVDCVARIRRVCEETHHPALAWLRERERLLIMLRDAKITQQIRRGR